MQEEVLSLRKKLKNAERVTVLTEINTDRTPHTGIMDFALKGRAGEIVPMLSKDWL